MLDQTRAVVFSEFDLWSPNRFIIDIDTLVPQKFCGFSIAKTYQLVFLNRLSRPPQSNPEPPDYTGTADCKALHRGMQ